MTQARPAAATVAFVDEYCRLYKDVFPDVRSLEHFTQIQIGMLTKIKRKTLPAIAREVRDGDPQALHHLIAYAPWQVEQLRDTRLTLLKQALAGRVEMCQIAFSYRLAWMFILRRKLFLGLRSLPI